MKFISSRMSSGNKLFPPEIYIEANGITIKRPGVFSSNKTFIGYKDIVSISLDSPVIGYSTITFFTNSNQIIINGFSKKDTEAIKFLIDQNKHA